MWLYNSATPTGSFGLWMDAMPTTNVAFCGTHLGKGMVSAAAFSVTDNVVATNSKIAALSGLTLMGATATGISYVNDATVREIRSPSGGVMQFKGLTQTTAND